MYFFETLLTSPRGTYPQAFQPISPPAHRPISLARSHTHTHTRTPTYTHTHTWYKLPRATSQSDPRLGSSWLRCWRACRYSLHSLVTVTSQEARDHRCHRTSGAKYHPIPFGRLSPKTRTQSQTQTRGKASKREREHPPRLLFQEAGCLSACHLFEIPPPHTPPGRPELAFRASEPLGTHSFASSPSSLGLGTGTWPSIARLSGWFVTVSRRCSKPGPPWLVTRT